MGAGGGGGGPYGSPPGRPRPSLLGASAWYTLAAVGFLLFGLGIWTPAWKGVAYGVELGLLVAVLGGVVVIVGLTYGWRAQVAARRTPIERMPGVEIFTPPAPAPGGAEATPALEEPEPAAGEDA
jgi:hypothetical protein